MVTIREATACAAQQRAEMALAKIVAQAEGEKRVAQERARAHEEEASTNAARLRDAMQEAVHWRNAHRLTEERVEEARHAERDAQRAATDDREQRISGMMDALNHSATEVDRAAATELHRMRMQAGARRRERTEARGATPSSTGSALTLTLPSPRTLAWSRTPGTH